MLTSVANDVKLPSKKLKLPYSLGPKIRAMSRPAIKEIPSLRIFVIKVKKNLTLALFLFILPERSATF